MNQVSCGKEVYNLVTVFAQCCISGVVSTGAVLLEVSKFWHEAHVLLYKLAHSLTPPSFVNLIKSYLTDRTFRVSIDGAFFQVRPVTTSILKVQYLIHTNDLSGVTMSVFADDTIFDYSPLPVAGKHNVATEVAHSDQHGQVRSDLLYS